MPIELLPAELLADPLLPVLVRPCELLQPLRDRRCHNDRIRCTGLRCSSLISQVRPLHRCASRPVEVLNCREKCTVPDTPDQAGKDLLINLFSFKIDAAMSLRREGFPFGFSSVSPEHEAMG